MVCGDASFRQINGVDALENPSCIIEVLSPASADYDRGTKFEAYKSIASFVEYLLVAQDRRHVARRVLQSDGSWNEVVYEAYEAVHLTSVGVELTLDEIYEGLAGERTTRPSPSV